MKQAAETSPIVASTGMTSSVMGIDPKHAARITKYLRDSIYSDKVRAVVHELIANALDEHRKYHVAAPVQTGIRNNGSGYSFYVRDFAKGLSEKDVREVFGMYANSTKLENNNQQGCFGIGSKSFHSYTDTFFVDSHFGGLKKTYACALGGDEMNVSVGHIYQVGEEPSNETGLEVYGDVKSSDLSNFSNKIRDFVSVSPDNIVANIIGESVEPIKPSFETKLGRFNMRVLEVSDFAFSPKMVHFQMGGNTYKKEGFIASNGGKIKDGHIIIIDIPIGDCSVTLSRESFEETAKNKEVFSEIDNLLEEYVLADAIQFKDKKVIDLVGDSLAGLKKFESDAFSYMIGDIYSDCWEFVNSIRLQGTGTQMMQNGKPVCIVIPANGIRAHWVDKVAEHLRKENLSAYVAGKTRYKSGDVDAAFHVICARKVKYAKVARDGKRYAVKTGGRSFGTFSPLEFFNAVSDRMKWGFAAANEKEAADFIATKKANVQTRHDLDYLRISQSAGTYKQWSAQSSKMINAVVALGFVEDGGKEDLAIRDRLHKEEQEKERKQNLVRKAKKAWVVISPRLQQAYQKEKNAERAFKFWSAVMKEGSLRGKILATYEDSYSKPKLERHELRRILKLV
jgi:hypothetical protein